MTRRLGLYRAANVNRVLKLVGSLLVTALFSWWAFRDTDWSGQWASVRSANYLWLIPYVCVLLLVHLTRTLRWGCLLSGQEKVRFKALNEASAIGFMMLIILPFRLGEFARPFLIAQRSQIRRSSAMTTVVLERIVDGLTIAMLLRVLTFFLPAETPETRLVKLGATAMFGVFGGGLAFLLFALWQRERAVRLVTSSVGALSPSAAGKVGDVVDRFVGALKELPKGGQLVGFFAYTAAYWFLNGFGMTLLARAFDCSGAPSAACVPISLNLYQGFVVLCVLVVGLMIPAAPGMMGTFQAGVKVGLGLFLAPEAVNSSGLAYANVLWFAQTVQQIGLGLLVLSLSQLSFNEIAGRLGKEPTALPATDAPRG